MEKPLDYFRGVFVGKSREAVPFLKKVIINKASVKERPNIFKREERKHLIIV